MISANFSSETPSKPQALGKWTPDRVFLTPEQSSRLGAMTLLPSDAKSVLRVEKKLQYGGYVWNDKNIAPGSITVKVDLRTQLVSVFKGGHEIGAAVILFGADDHETPIGQFPIRGKSREYQSKSYNAPMPYSLWLTEDGVALHGSKVRWGSATHGCVGVPLEFATKLFENAQIGDVVEIIRSPRPNAAVTSSMNI